MLIIFDHDEEQQKKELEEWEQKQKIKNITNESVDENIFLKYNLDPIDRQILRLLIANPGIKNEEIAEIVGKSKETVGWRQRREAFKKAYSEQLMSAPELFQKAQELAIKKLIQLIQGSNEKLAFEAAKIFAFPLMQAQAAALTPKVEETITFKTRIGPAGEIIRQHSIDGKSKEDIIILESE